jgi:hemolysin activation/secretion protein
MILAALAARGQDSRYVPKTPAENREKAAATWPALPAMTSNDDAVLLARLEGIVFLGERAALRPEGVEVSGVTTSRIPMLETPEVRELAGRFIGRPVTRRLLNELMREVVLLYRKHDRPIVDVLVPEQNISTGTLQVLVIEGRLGEVRAEGNVAFESEQLTRQVRARSGEAIAGGALLDDVTWLNQNPFRQVDLVFARGRRLGETDVVLRTRDRRPLRLYAGYEDSGNDLTGDERVLVGVNWGNAFGRDQLLNYQVMTSPDFEKLVAHSGSYVVPLRWRHTVTVFGSYATSRPVLSGGMFTLKGESWQASARYSVPLRAKSGIGLTHEVSAGVDFKRSNNNLEFGGVQVFDQWTDVAQAVANYAATFKDRWGHTTADVQLVWSPGGLTNDNRTSRFRAARAFARADYAYARMTVERTTKLPLEFKWVARLTAQVANRNLLSSEQLGLGGYDALRGYEEREANGDGGFVLTNEIRTKAFSPSKLMGVGGVTDRLEVLGFVDYGEAANHRLLAGEDAHLVLASVGGGLRYSIAPRFTLRADYGWQLVKSGVSDGRREHRGHVGVVVAY